MLAQRRDGAIREIGLDSTSGLADAEAVARHHRRLQISECDFYLDMFGNTLCPPGSSPVARGVVCRAGAACDEDTCCKGG